MPKTLVVCCDGTAQEFTQSPSNVLRLSNVLVQNEQQRVFYDPGVGTIASPGAVSAISKFLNRAMGLAFGYGLKTNIADAYKFLMAHYEPGDRIAMFGYSRGAYTVRCLAGLIHVCGLLRRGNEHLVPYAIKMYLDFDRWDALGSFRPNAHQGVPIDFMGVWDTVSSMYYEQRKMPHTSRNPALRVVRHAIAIDERRAYFRQNRFGAPNIGQDIREVWFPGVHGDVGGGAPEGERGPELAAFSWICAAARPFIAFNEAAFAAAAPEGNYHPIQPRLHDSMTGPWWIAEYFPKSYLKRDPDTGRWWRHWKLYKASPRYISEGSVIHQSAIDRMESGDYAPRNLPKEYNVEPW